MRRFCQLRGQGFKVEDVAVALIKRVEIEVVPEPDSVVIDNGPLARSVLAGFRLGRHRRLRLRKHAAQRRRVRTSSHVVLRSWANRFVPS